MPTIAGRSHFDDPSLSRVAVAPPTSLPEPELRYCAHRWCAREPILRGVCWAHYAQLTGRSQGRFRHAVRQPALSLAELIDEVDWLLGSDSPPAIAHRLGFTNPASLGRRLRRAKRDDLARHFESTRETPA